VGNGAGVAGEVGWGVIGWELLRRAAVVGVAVAGAFGVAGRAQAAKASAKERYTMTARRPNMMLRPHTR